MADFRAARLRMVERQIAGRGLDDERLLEAFREVPREAFVEPGYAQAAYDDRPLPIGEGQTISQPYTVALMVAAAAVRATDRVLEVGAGCGYATAILSRVAAHVYAVERHGTLGLAAIERLRRLGYSNVDLRIGDGTKGWPEAAPFDAIIVSAGGSGVPVALRDQLADGGRLVIPVGRSGHQRLLKLERIGPDNFDEEDLGGVLFVPLVSD